MPNVRTTPKRPREECPACGREVAYSLLSEKNRRGVWVYRWKKYANHNTPKGVRCGVKIHRVRR